MVAYWKVQESVSAKITRAKTGENVMYMEGEKEAFPGFPRGHILFGKLSKLKHEIKNQVFNDSWALLELGFTGKQVYEHVKKTALPKIFDLAKETQFDRLPPERMNPSVREIYRAWTKVAPATTYALRDILCFVLQEDDAYRFRAQWLVTFFGIFPSLRPLQAFDRALGWLEHGETIDDMKGKQRLLRRVLMAILEDERAQKLFVDFFKEVNWKKVALSKADKFHFRGKYFKVDLDKFEY